MKINDVRTYKIRMQGKVEEEDINPTSPMRLTLEQVGETSTSVTLLTDQSGLIGLIRHLHGLGLVLLSIDSHVETLSDRCSQILGDRQ